MNIWTVTYEHRHGSDVYLYPSEAKAEKGACDKIMEWLEEVEDPVAQASIASLISDDMFKEAISRWTDYQSESPQPESICVKIAHSFDFPIDTEDLVNIREMLLNLEKKYPEVLFDGILKDLDLSNEVFEGLQKKLDEAVNASPDDGDKEE
jgi:hypothetical protein